MATVKRSYHAPLRAAQAAQTRHRVVEAAADLFAHNGWLGTTVGDIAATAGVTPQAVHNSVGGKPALLMAAVRAAVAGGEPDTPLADRDAFQLAFHAEATVPQRAAAFAAGAVQVYGRAAPLFLVLASAAPADGTLAQLWHEARARRLEDCHRLVRAAGRRSPAQLRRRSELLFVQSGPGVYVELIHDLGWDAAAYEDWLVGAVAGLLA